MSRKLNPTRFAQVQALVAQGMNAPAIEQALGLDERTARWYVQQVKAQTVSNGHAPSPAKDSAGATSEPHTGLWTPDQPALKPHPLADLFPPLDDHDLAALTADIQAQGLRDPIWVYEGMILDGRNRFRVCETLGLPCPTREYTGDDPLGFVLSKNLHRRHLTESQRAMIGTKLATMRQGERTDLQPSENSPKVSQAKAAELLNVSDFSLKAAKKVRADAQPEVVKAVEAGRIAVSAAAKLANQPATVQRAVVQQLETGAATTVPAALAQVQGTAPPPTRAEGRWLDPLGPVQTNLLAAIHGFDSFGGLAQVLSTWTPEQRAAFRERVAYIDARWQQFIRALRASEQAIPLDTGEAPQAPLTLVPVAEDDADGAE